MTTTVVSVPPHAPVPEVASTLFVAAVRADRDRLLHSFVKLYNGAGSDETTYMPYRSTLDWDSATAAFVQPAGPVLTPNPNSGYIFAGGSGFVARYARTRAGFTAPDRVDGVPVATVGALRNRLYNFGP